MLRRQSGEGATKAGDKCVLIKKLGVLVVGLLQSEWELLLDRPNRKDRMQLISGVEEAVVRGISQSENTPEAQPELKSSWNQWALKLCEGERRDARPRKGTRHRYRCGRSSGLQAALHTCTPRLRPSLLFPGGYPRTFSALPSHLCDACILLNPSRPSTPRAPSSLSPSCVPPRALPVEGGTAKLRCKCLLQRVVLLLNQQQHTKALDSAAEVLRFVPDSKHALALLATAQHKAGKKKQAAVTLTDLSVAFQNADGENMSEELGHPLDLTVALLVEMHRTKDALKMLGSLLARVTSSRQQHLFLAIARLFAKHGLNKDSLAAKLPVLCCNPPDQRTWKLLKSMADCTPLAVETLLKVQMGKVAACAMFYVPKITEIMCKLPAADSAAAKALAFLRECAEQVSPQFPDDLRIVVEDIRALASSNVPAPIADEFPRLIEQLLVKCAS